MNGYLRLLRHALIAAAAFLPLAAAPAAHAAPQSETASSGQVSASVTWDRSTRAGASQVHVTINRAGTELVSQDVQPRCTEFCWEPPGDEPLRLRDLNADGEPEVLLDLYTGGAHCCTMLLIYGFDATTGQYRRLRRDFGNPGYTLRDAGGDEQVEIFTEDDRFTYLFTSYLESARALMILRYDGRTTVDVTRRFPDQIERHRKQLFNFYKRLRRDRDLDLRGVLAAWQADNYLLGRAAAARGWRTLEAARQRGELKRIGANGGPTDARYLRKLRSYLKRFGYAG